MYSSIKKNKIFRNTFNKRSIRLVPENAETLLKETKGNLNKWKDIPHPWIGRLNIVKELLLYTVNAVPIKIPAALFFFFL